MTLAGSGDGKFSLGSSPMSSRDGYDLAVIRWHPRSGDKYLRHAWMYGDLEAGHRTKDVRMPMGYRRAGGLPWIPAEGTRKSAFHARFLFNAPLNWLQPQFCLV
jgi:hypothetical protein